MPNILFFPLKIVNGFFPMWLFVDVFSFPADLFDVLSHWQQEEVTTALMFFFLNSLIYWVFVVERVLSLKRLPCRSAAVLVTSNPGKTEKKPETLLSQVLTSFLRTCFTSCSLLGSRAAARVSERRMLSVKCCCLCFSPSVWCYSSRLRCPVCYMRRWVVRSHTRMHRYWSWFGLTAVISVLWRQTVII